jgi:hypothetical protein
MCVVDASTRPGLRNPELAIDADRKNYVGYICDIILLVR